MTHNSVLRALAILAIMPASATLYFFGFWSWFDFWRRHRILTYSFMFGTLYGLAVATYVFRRVVLGPAIEFPIVVRVLGWSIVAIASVFGMIADRQLGMRIRAFTPFFESHGHIRLRTTGAYGVVRHPIYAAGIAFQAGVFLVTGYLAVAVAWIVLTLGALWFTRQEERRLIALLDDPSEYDRYRARVPALVPRLRFRRR